MLLNETVDSYLQQQQATTITIKTVLSLISDVDGNGDGHHYRRHDHRYSCDTGEKRRRQQPRK